MTGKAPIIGLDLSLPTYPTVVHALAHAAREAPDRAALICAGSTLAYGQYLRAAAGLAHHLGKFDVAGERVVLLMSNANEMAVAMMGAMAARAQMVPFNPNYTATELATLLPDAAPKVLICDAHSIERGREAAAAAGIPNVEYFGDGGLDLGLWTDDAQLELPEPLPATEELATLPYTGGTTGLPKGANHQHSSVTSFFNQSYSQWPVGFDTNRFLTVAPMFHIWGFQFATWVPVYTRGTLVIVPQYKPERVLKAFEEHKITVFAGGPPAIYIGLMAHENFAQTDFSNLAYCVSGGAPCPEDLIRNWERDTGCALLEGLGMSEGAPICSNPINGVRKILSVGPPAPLAQIEIVDLETGTLVMPTGDKGEVRLKGPQFASSYRNRPEENAQTFRDGWLYTGDIGYFDDDDYLFLVDRKKELVLVGGFNVYPREIDELLFNHPAIQEAAAIGIPDRFKGEVVKAFVVLKPGRRLSEDEVIAHCAEHLVKYKVPVAVEFMDALPKTGAGKIAKKVLRAAEKPES